MKIGLLAFTTVNGIHPAALANWDAGRWRAKMLLGQISYEDMGCHIRRNSCWPASWDGR